MAGEPLYPYKALLPAPIYWLYRGIRTIGVALCFAGFWSGVVALAWLWLPIVLLWPGTRVEKMHRAQRSMRHGFWFFHFWMRLLRLYCTTSPVKAVRPGKSPVVLVANHPTLCDVTSMVALFPNVVSVARASFGENPLLSRAVRRTGLVPTGIQMIRDCQERLAMGFDVLVFPEGTRSPIGGLHPFHRGAFELAARAKVPIVLLKLTCVPSALSKRLPIWKIADRMAVLTIEPFATIEPNPAVDSRALCREIEQRYRDVLGYPGSADVADAPQAVGDAQ